ncbi:hypothetical protein BU15DRAFT_84351 [Melanogaster broomeanus]|nr:hypothetical protein BU15DRAFT_84351 [Melanogaster broomeanus]
MQFTDAPSGPIAEEFRQYINNEIPIRFIDTMKLQRRQMLKSPRHASKAAGGIHRLCLLIS